MLQEEKSYRDETYYLFNEALNQYRTHLQQIHNRGMIESWIAAGDIEDQSVWTVEETMAYFENLPYPENEVERKIWLAGYNSTQCVNDNEQNNDKQDAVPERLESVPELLLIG